MLYYKVHDPSGAGRRIFLMEPNGMKRVKRNNKSVEVYVYNDRPCNPPLSEADEKRFLAQDPHLLTTEIPDFTKKHPTTVEEWQERAKSLEVDLKEALKDAKANDEAFTEKDVEIDRLRKALEDSIAKIEELTATCKDLEEKNVSLQKHLDAKDKALAGGQGKAKKG